MSMSSEFAGDTSRETARLRRIQACCMALLVAIWLIGLPLAAQARPPGAEGREPVLSASALREGQIALDSGWRYRPGDGPWAGRIDDSAWERLDGPPLFSRRHPPQDGWDGEGWFRLPWTVASDLEGQVLALSVQHYGSSEVFYDGRPIGSFVIDPRQSPLMVQLGKAGPHVLAVHYRSPELSSLGRGMTAWFELTRHGPGLVVAADLPRRAIDDVVSDRFGDLAIHLVLTGIGLAFAALHLMIFSFLPAERGNLYFSLFALSLACNGLFTAAERYGWFGVGAVAALLFFNRIAGLFVMLTLVLFLSSVAGVRLGLWAWSFAALTAGVEICFLVPGLQSLHNGLYLLFLFVAAALSCWLVLLAVWRRLEGSWAVAVAGFGWLIFLASEMVKEALALSIPAQVTAFGISAFLFFVGFSVYLGQRLAHQGRDLEALNRDLERLVSERTADLARSEDEAQQASAAKSSFLAMMSHEIRTPMNAVIGMADLLAGSGLDPESMRMARTIRSSGHLLMAVLGDVLDFSKIEAGQVQVERTELRLEDLVAEVGDLFAQAAKDRGIAFSWRVEGNPPMLLGDPTRLRQILTNLMSNAIKFTDEGTVELFASTHPLNGTREEVHIEVRDTGIGMSDENMSRLFRPFTQAESSTTRRFGGTGLGLAIAQQLAHLMGGHLEVESKSGTGSIFRLRMPLERVDVAAAVDVEWPRPEPVERDQLAALKILIAEDEEVNRLVMSAMLERLGCRAEVATRGSEVVEEASSRAYDVILMDIQMPDLDGYEATARIRRDTLSAGAYIVALTANVDTETRARCAQVGMNEFVGKPLVLDQLRSTLAKAARTLRSAQGP